MKIKFMKFISFIVTVSAVLFSSLVYFSSKSYITNEITGWYSIKKGYPYNFIKITNNSVQINYLLGILDYLIVVLAVSVLALLFYSVYLNSRNFSLKKLVSTCIVFMLIIFLESKNVYAATSYAQSWRILHNGKLQYSCASKYSSVVNDAKNEWNKYKNGVITEGNSPDVVIRGSGSLGYEINGVTYSSGVIYFNSDNWAYLSTKERKNLARHELGHALGLAHNPGKENIMYKNTTSKLDLSADDKASYNEAYALSYYRYK